MKTRKIVFTGLFIACSFIGANLKIASSIALDSMAAFLGALILGPLYGGIIGAFGHLLTAYTSSFPYGLPIHLTTMISMFISVYVFGKVQIIATQKLNKWMGIVIGTIIAVVFNGPVALLMITPFMGKAAFALTPLLSFAALVNTVFAQLIFLSIPQSVREKYKGLR